MKCKWNTEAPEKQDEYQPDEYWIFTFGVGTENARKLVKIKGSYAEARKKMLDLYDDKWCFQYSEKEWEEWINEGKDLFAGQYEMEVIE